METYLKELEHHLRLAVERFKLDLQGIRTSRPTTQLIENIEAEYAGGRFPVKQLASLGVKPPREIDITVWDQAAVNPIVKALQDAKVGLSLSNEGNVIRAFLPPLSEERREELTKLTKKIAEETRIKIRTSRDDTQKKMKAAEARKELNEDQMFKGKEKIQKLVDEMNRQVETLVEGKLKELRE